MHTVRLSLFCAAALLVNGAYANELTGSAGATARTAEFVVPASPSSEARVRAQLQGFGELSQQTSRAARDDGQWLRISDDGDIDTANRGLAPPTIPRVGCFDRQGVLPCPEAQSYC